MPVVAFNFTKISAEKTAGKSGQVNVKNSVKIKDAAKTKLALGPQSQEVLRVVFEFTSTYEPGMGSIVMEGEVIHMDKPEKIDAMIKAWQKDNQLPRADSRPIINHLLSKCNVEAILLSRELNLPSPIELPRIASK